MDNMEAKGNRVMMLHIYRTFLLIMLFFSVGELTGFSFIQKERSGATQSGLQRGVDSGMVKESKEGKRCESVVAL